MIKIPDITEVDKTYKIGPARLRIEQDCDSRNPFEENDCNPPLAAFPDRSITKYDAYGDPVDPFEGAPDEWINEKWPELCKSLEVDQAESDAEIQEDLQRYNTTLTQCRREKLEEALKDMKPSGWRAAEKYFDTLAELWELRGIKALSTQVNGYCQGDSTLLLLVATPKYLEVTGVGPDAIEKDLESSAALYGAWAFGDIYGYVIKDEDGEELGSCWGFYGIPWGNNPRQDDEWDVAEQALESLASEAPHQAKEALKKAKEARQEFLALRRECRLIPRTEALTSTRSLVANACREKAQEYLKQKKRIEAWAELAEALKKEEPANVDR